MKKLIAALAVTALFTACHKDKVQVPANGFTGSWELRTAISGWTALVTYPPGNGNRYTFTADSTYTKYEANQLKAQGKFCTNQIGTDNGAKYGLMKFTNPAFSDVYHLKSDSLIIGTSAADGSSWLYVRVK